MLRSLCVAGELVCCWGACVLLASLCVAGELVCCWGACVGLNAVSKVGEKAEEGGGRPGGALA